MKISAVTSNAIILSIQYQFVFLSQERAVPQMDHAAVAPIGACPYRWLRDQPIEEGSKEYEEDLGTESATSSRRHSPIPVSKYNTTTVVSSQPRPRAPPSLPSYAIDKDHPSYQDTRRVDKRSSIWMGDGPEMASRAVSKVRRMSSSRRSRHGTSERRSASRRRQVSEPTEFRRVCISPVPRLPAFRPIQLSIYIPGNELPKLPRFSDDPEDEDDDIPLVPEIPRPAQALMKSRSDTLLTRAPSNFSIPRKPLVSRESSFDDARLSTDSEVTMAEPHWRPRTSSLYHVRSRRPSTATNATSRSNQDFLELLNQPLPPLPRPTLKPSDNPPENASSIFRRASDQSKRLQTHLAEREQVDAHSPDCSTIAEERSPVSGLTSAANSPINRQSQPTSILAELPLHSPPEPTPQGLALTPIVPSTGILTTSQFSQSRELMPVPTTTNTENQNATIFHKALPSDQTSFNNHHIRTSSSLSSTTLLNLTASAGTPDLYADSLSQKPTVTTTVIALHEKPSVGTRLSQWLSRSKSASKDSLRPWTGPLRPSSSSPDLPFREGHKRADSALSGGAGSWFDGRESMEFDLEGELEKVEGLFRNAIVGGEEGRRRRSETMSTLVGGERVDFEKVEPVDHTVVGVAI